ncbi:DUF6233 domain-containing protein [Streptomyces nigra]|uniref:DUF6233 domain-containing protein n=1 Tax=Streptomyces nigra TaxID=1827580 RepID=UPI003821499A
MSSASSPLPSIRVILPDDQEFSRARGVARGVTQRIGAAWVSYDDVPTHRLPREADQAPPSDRWAWKVQQVPPRDRRPGWFAVHIWDCGDTSAGDPEVDVHEAPDVLRTVGGAEACKECGAAVALGPLLDSGPENEGATQQDEVARRR